MFVAIVLRLCQSCTSCNDITKILFTIDNQDVQCMDLVELCKDNHTDSLKSVLYFIMHLIARSLDDVTGKGKPKSERNDSLEILEIFLNEYVLLIRDPEWPIVHSTLFAVTNLLVSKLDAKVESSLRTKAMDFIVSIAKALYRAQKIDVAIPTSFEQPEIVDMIITSKSESFYLKLYNEILFGSAGQSYLENCSIYNLSVVGAAVHEIPSDEGNLTRSFTALLTSAAKGEARATEINLKTLKGYLLTTWIFTQQYMQLVQVIIKQLESENVGIRLKAISSLEEFHSVEIPVISHLVQRLFDSAPGVRGVTLDLFGRFVISDTSILQKYYPQLVERILDVSATVRKKAMKLLVTIMDKYACDRNMSAILQDIFLRILTRLEDEEVGVVVHVLFTLGWSL